MKFKEGIILTQNGNEYVLVAAGEAGKCFSGLMKLNTTAAEIAKLLQQETEEKAVALALCKEYDIPMERALQSVKKTVQIFADAGIMTE